MEFHPILPEQYIYTATIENITIGLLIEEIDPNVPADAPLTYMIHHTHVYTELFACHSGQIIISTEYEEICLHPGDAVLIPAKVMHVKTRDASDTHYSVIGMTYTYHNTKYTTDLYHTIHVLCSGKIVILRNQPIFCDTVAALVRPSDNSAALPALRLALLLAEMASAMRPDDTQHTQSDDFRADTLDRVSRLDYLIDSYFMNDMTAGYAAEQLFISERQLARIMKKRYGMTFHEKIQEKRLSVAAKMLSETNLPVTEIAQQVGFKSVCTFYRSFHQQYGMTPAKYREQ